MSTSESADNRDSAEKRDSSDDIKHEESNNRSHSVRKSSFAPSAERACRNINAKLVNPL
jgi:hypothetical protein